MLSGSGMAVALHQTRGLMICALVASTALAAGGQESRPRERVAGLFQKALQAEQSGDFVTAVEDYRQITRLDPQIAEVWSNLGMNLYREGKNGDAIEAFRHATSLKPSLLAPHLFAGKAYLDMGNTAKALPLLEGALALAPNEPQTLLALGDAYALNHQYPSAVEILGRALRRDPDSEDASSRLAVTYLEWATQVGGSLRKSPSAFGQLLHAESRAVEHPEDAMEAFQKAVGSFPSSSDLRLAYAGFLMANQPSPAGLEICREQVLRVRETADTSGGIAMSIRLAIARSKLEEAIEELNSLAAHDPEFLLSNVDDLTAGIPISEARGIEEHAKAARFGTSPSPGSYSLAWKLLTDIRAHRRLTQMEAIRYASVAWHLHKYADALRELTSQVHLTDEGNYWLYRTCAEVAKQMLEATVDAHPKSIRSHLLLADLALQQDQIAKARVEYDAALVLGPHDPDVQLLHVRFLETARDTEHALAEAKAYADEFPSNADLNFEAGDLILHAGTDPSSATRYLQRAVSANPRPITPHLDLADAFAQSLRFEDAIEEANRVAAADTNGSVHYRLGLWYRQTGRQSEAANAFQQSKLLKEQSLRAEQRPPPESSARQH